MYMCIYIYTYIYIYICGMVCYTLGISAPMHEIAFIDAPCRRMMRMESHLAAPSLLLKQSWNLMIVNGSIFWKYCIIHGFFYNSQVPGINVL